MQNFSSLAGLEVTEKFDLIYFFRWVGGRVGGWPGGWVGGLSETGNKAITASIEVEVEAELGKNYLDPITSRKNDDLDPATGREITDGNPKRRAGRKRNSKFWT